MYFHTKVMSRLFLESFISGGDITFRSLRTVDDIWKYLEGPLLENLYWNDRFPKKSLDENESFIYFENVLLGVPRIRQVKVTNTSCSVHGSFAFEMECYDAYLTLKEDTASFGPMNSTAWIYSPPSSVVDIHWGWVSTYSGGGFYLDLEKAKEKNADKIRTLRSNRWLTRGSRAVFIDFSVYNSNINLFCVVRLVAELPATGGVLTSWQFYSVKLLRYVSSVDYVLALCEVVFCLFIIAFGFQECVELYQKRCSYFIEFWNCLELILIVMSVVAISFNVYRTSEVHTLLESLQENPQKYPDFHFLAFWQTQYNNMIAVNVFICWVKVFKYINFNKTMNTLTSTLSHCAKDVIGFAVMFFIIFFAYAQLAYLLFGSQVENFSTFKNCVFTQFRIILGDINFNEIEHSNRILGPIYFTTFVFFVFFILLNMFLAIINDTYSEVKLDQSIQNAEFEVTDFIKKACGKALVKLNFRKKLQGRTTDCNHEAGEGITLNTVQIGTTNQVETEEHFTAFGTESNTDITREEREEEQIMGWDLERQKERVLNSTHLDKGEEFMSLYVPRQEYQQLAEHVSLLQKRIDALTFMNNRILVRLNSFEGINKLATEDNWDTDVEDCS
ncbi:polycystin-2 isoform X2 [Lepisosteus oculatus]|nr:PREDICTED: polycystic kidney disease 2-like 2 protein isoform X4 [Lepisosteus oculatus]XP_015205289.1 PREDICTED: polycystic kidney disease 2-like 2 protein isoform X4 [Lepisosteus oculatus]XP_015205290.1 PREDICTED: polycystic kidney disease 2-like 2 protein isoform X4 [Lepisosteus oculatus]